MRIAVVSLSLLTALFGLSACSPKESASEKPEAAADSFPLVPEKNRAASFEAVAHDLDLGGTSFTFVDLGTMFQELGGKINRFVGGMAAMQPTDMSMAMASAMPYDKLVDVLGLSDLSAVGTSSYLEGPMYRNKAVVYLPGGAKGIFALMGNEPHSFDTLALAPAGTDIFVTQDIQGSVIADVIRNGAETLMPGNGEQMAAGILGQPLGQGTPVTVGDALDKADTTLSIVVRFGEMSEMPLPMTAHSISVPQTQFLMELKGMAWLVTEGVIPIEMEVSEGTMTRTEENGLVIYKKNDQLPTLSLAGGEGILVVDTATNDLITASDKAFFEECRAGKTPLTGSPTYQAAIQDLPTEGNGLTYVSQKGFDTFIQLRNGLLEQFPQAAGMLAIYEFYIPLLGLDKVEADAASVTVVRPDSLFTDSRWPTSSPALSGNASGVAITGMLAAMAIPAFNKVRTESRQKTITNNLRQVASAGMHYMLENGVSEVGYDKLINTYFDPIKPVNGESYEDLVVKETGGTLKVTTADGKTVSYGY